MWKNVNFVNDCGGMKNNSKRQVRCDFTLLPCEKTKNECKLVLPFCYTILSKFRHSVESTKMITWLFCQAKDRWTTANRKKWPQQNQQDAFSIRFFGIWRKIKLNCRLKVGGRRLEEVGGRSLEVGGKWKGSRDPSFAYTNVSDLPVFERRPGTRRLIGF